ncbi:MAG TPA: hypothetical protein VGN26_16520 [Armatimonadota bacterium]
MLLAGVRPAEAVSWITMDGHPEPAVLTVGQNVTVQADVSSIGAKLNVKLVLDANRNHAADVGETVYAQVTMVDGGFDFDPVPKQVIFTFTPEDFYPAGPYVVVAKDSDGSVITAQATILPRPQTLTLSGKVVDAAGQPTEGIVWAVIPDVPSHKETGTLTQPDGTFQLPLEGSRDFGVFAEFADKVDSELRWVHTSDADVPGLRLQLRDGLPVAGQVTNRNLIPLPGALVGLFLRNGLLHSVTRTWADGSYVAAGPPGQVTVRPLLLIPDPPSRETELVILGAQNMDFQVSSWGRLHGAISCEGGAPLFAAPRVVVSAAGQDVSFMADDLGGLFDLALSPGSYAFAASLGGYASDPAQETATVVAASDVQVALHLKPSSALLGDANGNGRVEVSDVILLMGILLGLSPLTYQALEAGDLAPKVGTAGKPQGDGRISIADVTLLLRQVAGLP